jgi:hypothetical protein
MYSFFVVSNSGYVALDIYVIIPEDPGRDLQGSGRSKIGVPERTLAWKDSGTPRELRE